MFEHDGNNQPFLTVLALLVSLLVACGKGEAPSQVIVVEEGGLLPTAAPEAAAVDDVAEVINPENEIAVAAEPWVAALPEPAPPPVGASPLPEPTTQHIPATGGVVEAGSYVVTIPGLEEEVEAEWEPLSETALREPRPLSVVVSAAELRPLYTTTTEMMEVTLPLRRDVPLGTHLQLLSFNRSMESFFVVDENTVHEAGTITFRTDMFSQYAVIARPELGQTDCPGGPFRVRERVPNVEERLVVGEVPVESRMPREVGFSVLADMRFLPGSNIIVFKNEERHANPSVYHDEDFLVDPRLAGPLIMVARDVLDQWVDPIGGGPAFRLRVTDAFDTMIEHSPRSNHYRGRAVDLTLSPVPPAQQQARADYYGRLSRLSVCAGFDFVHFENRHHVHASSQETRVAFLEDRSNGTTIVSTGLDGANRVEFQSVLGYPLTTFDVQGLRFDDDGYLEVLGVIGGEDRVYRLDLRHRIASQIPDHDPIHASPPVVSIDPSLLLEAAYGQLFYRRPGPPLELGVSLEHPPLRPFALTSGAVHGRLPAVWTEPWSPPSLQ